MNALAIQLYLTIRYINLSFNYFGNFYRIIVTFKSFKFSEWQKNESMMINIYFKVILLTKKPKNQCL